MREARRVLALPDREVDYYALAAVEAAGLGPVSRLPVAHKVLLENLLRHEDGVTVTREDIAALAAWSDGRGQAREIAFHPSRVLATDSAGIPLLADLAAMRDAMLRLGGDPRVVNPAIPVDCVIDHSVNVDFAGDATALARNVALEYERNHERYSFTRWCQESFDRMRVVPPGNGICHQINLEYLAPVVGSARDADGVLVFPDTVLGTDSHTPMTNALGVVGWGVGGLDVGAAIVGEPVAMTIPEVVGCRLVGRPREGVTATDIVLTVTQALRAFGVVNKFVEFCGSGLAHLPLSARATISNMAPEYGATIGLFPIDAETLRYLRLTARPAAHAALVEAYAKVQGLWHDAATPEAAYAGVLEIDLAAVTASLAGPRRPHERRALAAVPAAFRSTLVARGEPAAAPVAGADYTLRDGDVVVASITSCTNTSNPETMIAAGLLARKAVERGLRVKPWVKTSLSPGSTVVADYLHAAGLQASLDALGFHVVGFGCMTCMGNSGAIAQPIEDAIRTGALSVAAVLSGNRNFEGRVHPSTRANFLASPPLVVAYALAGSVARNLEAEPLGKGRDGTPVYLRDVWPTDAEIAAVLDRVLSPALFRARYDHVFEGDERWRSLPVPQGATFAWDARSTYMPAPLLFEGVGRTPAPLRDIAGARPLAILGDAVTTDHISPVGRIASDGSAGRYLVSLGVDPADFNSFAARRVNYEVLIRGTFSNPHLANAIVPGVSGGFTRHVPSGEVLPIYDAAQRYRAEGVPLVVVGGKDYGAGSARDWAAKGTVLLGVRAVIAEGFERIHRGNLTSVGVLPLQFPPGVTRETLGLDGSEIFDLQGIAAGVTPRMTVRCVVRRSNGASETIDLLARVDTVREAESVRHGGILNAVLRQMLVRPAGPHA